MAEPTGGDVINFTGGDEDLNEGQDNVAKEAVVVSNRQSVQKRPLNPTGQPSEYLSEKMNPSALPTSSVRESTDS